jgi:hypothetical protein
MSDRSKTIIMAVCLVVFGTILALELRDEWRCKDLGGQVIHDRFSGPMCVDPASIRRMEVAR